MPIVAESTGEENANLYRRGVNEGSRGELLDASELLELLDVFGENGYVEERYVDSMFEHEELVSTFVGNAVAIPHGTGDSKQWVTASGLSIITVPEGVEYGDGNVAKLVIGIASKGDEHLEILSRIATVCQDEDNVNKIVRVETKEELLAFFEEVEEVG